MLTSKRPPRSSKKPLGAQSKAFIDAAREAGCDDDPKAFERVFGKIVPPKKKGEIAPAKEPK